MRQGKFWQSYVFKVRHMRSKLVHFGDPDNLNFAIFDKLIFLNSKFHNKNIIFVVNGKHSNVGNLVDYGNFF